VELRRLDAADDRSRFRCGDEALDRFFAQQAGQGLQRATNVTYVIVDEGIIAAFVTVMPAVVPGKELGISRLPPGGVPVLLLARMGVALERQGSGLGAALTAKAMNLALAMAEQVGCVGLVVDAKEKAHAFYERLGFVWLGAAQQNGSRRGLVPIQTLRRARS
jgi:GNAT superfamily N-acetyltransferase